MCNIDRKAEAQLLRLGLTVISKAIEASLSENTPIASTDFHWTSRDDLGKALKISGVKLEAKWQILLQADRALQQFYAWDNQNHRVQKI